MVAVCPAAISLESEGWRRYEEVLAVSGCGWESSSGRSGRVVAGCAEGRAGSEGPPGVSGRAEGGVGVGEGEGRMPEAGFETETAEGAEGAAAEGTAAEGADTDAASCGRGGGGRAGGSRTAGCCGGCGGGRDEAGSECATELAVDGMGGRARGEVGAWAGTEPPGGNLAVAGAAASSAALRSTRPGTGGRGRGGGWAGLGGASPQAWV